MVFLNSETYFLINHLSYPSSDYISLKSVTCTSKLLLVRVFFRTASPWVCSSFSLFTKKTSTSQTGLCYVFTQLLISKPRGGLGIDLEGVTSLSWRAGIFINEQRSSTIFCQSVLGCYYFIFYSPVLCSFCWLRGLQKIWVFRNCKTLTKIFLIPALKILLFLNQSLTLVRRLIRVVNSTSSSDLLFF